MHVKYIASAIAVFTIMGGLFINSFNDKPEKLIRYKVSGITSNAVVTDITETDSVTAAETSEVTTELVTGSVTTVSAVSDTSCVTSCEASETSISEETVIPETASEEEMIQGVINGKILFDAGYEEYQLPDNPNYRGFKSYEPYYMITAQSVQLYLQYDAVTDANGFRLLDDRYLVAVGTFCNAPCGTYIDLLLDNGILIPCIVGDIKADEHTDETHAYTRHSMCASEFIIDDGICPAAWSGDISTMYDEWNSKVKAIRVYAKNYY